MSEHLDRSENSFGETTNSTGGQHVWSIASAEKVAFQVTLAVSKVLERPSRKWKLVGRAIILIQILGIVVTPQLWHPTTVRSFAQVVVAFQGPVWDSTNFGVSHLQSGIILFVVAFLVILYLCLWGWSIRAYSRESVRPWTTKLLARCVQLSSSVLFIPFLRIFAVHLACVNTTDGYELTGYRGVNCFQDPFALALFIVAALCCTAFIACVVATDLLVFNPAHHEKFLDDKPTGRIDALSRLSTVGMILVAHLLMARPIQFVAAYVIYAALNAALYATTLPYYKSLYNSLAIATWCMAFGAGIAGIASVSTGQSLGAAVALYVLLPFSFAAGFVAARELYKQRIRWIDRHLPDPHEDDENHDASHTPMGAYHKRDRSLKEYWPFVFQLEINTRFLLEDLTPENVERAERMLVYQCRHFPSAMAEITYVQFLVSFKRDPIVGRVRINRARKLEPTVDERLMLTRLETIFEEERLADAHGESISAAGLADMRKRLQDARRYHLDTLKSFSDFWKELAHDDVKLARLPDVMSRIEHSEERADFAFGKLMSKFPSSKVVLRAYSQYLEEVKMDEAAAQEYAQKADMLENIRRTAGVGRRSLGSSHHSLSLGTSTHTRGSGGSSDVLRRLASAGQATELTEKVQNSSAMRMLRMTARVFFLGLFVFVIIAFALFHADQARKVSKLPLYEASGNRAALVMRVCTQARLLQVAAMLVTNDTATLRKVDAARAELRDTLVLLEYEHKRATVGADNTPVSDYPGQQHLIKEPSVAMLQLVERYPPMLQQRQLNILDSGLSFIENAHKIAKYGVEELTKADDDPAFRFVLDNGSGVLVLTCTFSNDMLVTEEEASDTTFEYTLIILLVVFGLVLNVPGWVMFQNVFDGIREERNFALNLFLLIPKTVIRHMLKERRFQQNTQKNVVGTSNNQGEHTDEEGETTSRVDGNHDGTLLTARSQQLDLTIRSTKGKGAISPKETESPRDLTSTPKRQVQWHAAPKEVAAGPAPAALDQICEETSSDSSMETQVQYTGGPSVGDLKHSRSTSEPMLLSLGVKNPGMSRSQSERINMDELPEEHAVSATSPLLPTAENPYEKNSETREASRHVPKPKPERKKGKEKREKLRVEPKPADEVTATEESAREPLIGATTPESEVEVATRRRCCRIFCRGNQAQRPMPLWGLLVVMFLVVLLQLAVTVPLLLLPAAHTAIAEQHATLRATTQQYIILQNSSEMPYQSEFVHTGDQRSYEAYEDYRGGGMLDNAIEALRELGISADASEMAGNFQKYQNQCQHYTRIALALTLLRFNLRPIRNYLSYEYPWSFADETDYASNKLAYPTVKYPYTNRSVDSARSPTDMGRIAISCIGEGIYKDLKKWGKEALLASRANATSAHQIALVPLWTNVSLLANIAFSLEPVILVLVLISALMLRVQVVTHFSTGELKRHKAGLMITLISLLVIGGCFEMAGIQFLLQQSNGAFVPAIQSETDLTQSSDAFFAVTEALRAVRDFADTGRATNFRSYVSARSRAWAAIDLLSTATAPVVQQDTITQMRATFAELDNILCIGGILARAGLGLDASVTANAPNQTWDITQEKSYQSDRITYSKRLTYTNNTADMSRSPDEQLRIAMSILYDQKFGDVRAAFSTAVSIYANASMGTADTTSAALLGNLSLLTYAFVGLNAALVGIAFLGYWGSYVTITRHIKSKSTTIIKQHVEVPSAKRMSRNFTILAIVATTVAIAFFVSVLQLMQYSSGTAWRARQVYQRAKNANEVVFLAGELYESSRGFPHWSDALARQGGPDLKLLQHINVFPTSVAYRRRLGNAAAIALKAKDRLLFGDSTHSEYGIFGHLRQQEAFLFNLDCVVLAKESLVNDGVYVSPADCPGSVYTSAHTGMGGLHILFFDLIAAARGLFDSVNDAGMWDVSVRASVDWMRQAIGPLNNLIAQSSAISMTDARSRLAMTQTVNIVVLVVCGITLIALFLACAQRWIKEIALEETRTKGMLDMIPEDAFVIRDDAGRESQ